MTSLPYKVACLCDLRDERGRVLLLHRIKEPNKGMCSPIGGKLDMASGESPAQCARREIHEEAEIEVPIERLQLIGLISERAYEGKTNWLIFYYRVLGAVQVKTGVMGEGELAWHDVAELERLPIPETDKKIIWPLVRRVEKAAGPDGKPGFFAVHIECDANGTLGWTVEQCSGE